MLTTFANSQAEKEALGEADVPVQTRADMRLAARYVTEVAKEVCDSLVAEGRLKEKPAFIRTIRGAGYLFTGSGSR